MTRMPSNVRSVTVRLEAMVARYIRDMNRAGDATEKAFDRVHASTSRAREEFVATERAADRLSTSTSNLNATTRLATPSQQRLRTATDEVGAAVKRTTNNTKDYTLAMALADERAAQLRKSLRAQARGMLDLGNTTRRTGSDINQLSGRIGIALKSFAILGPTLAPIGAVATAGLAGLSAQLGFAATGALSVVVASQGVGDALKAVNEAALEPTAANLDKARIAMRRLGPEARSFVERFQEIRPVLTEIRDAAAGGWFPGLTEALDSFETAGPRVASMFEAIGRAGGNLVADGAQALNGPQWSEFMSFVEANAPQALDELGRSVGNVITGLAELWMAFDPLNDSFSSWMLDASAGFAEWAAGLKQTEGFHEFVDYIRTNGPKVGDALAAIGNAILQIVEAAAPIGGPVLDALASVADAIATIADSPLGTPIMAGVAAMSALSLATNVATAALTRFTVTSAAAGAAGAGVAGKGVKGGKAGGLLGLAGGGPAGLAALASIVGVTDQVNNAKASLSGEQSPWEGLLRGAVPAFNTLEMFGVEIPGLTAKTKDLADANEATGSSYLDLGAATSSARERLVEYNQTSLGSFSATTQYREALKAATEQANSNNAGIKGNSDAALDNRAALEQLAGAWQNQRAQMSATGASANEVAAKQRNARRAFIETATAMGVSRRRARELADALLGIPPAVSSSVNVAGLGTALQGVRTLKAELAGLGNPKVSAPQPKGTAPLFGGAGADGMTVPGQRTPYGDKTLIWAAPGEEIITNRNGEADRFRADRAAGRIPAYADGGTVGSRYASALAPLTTASLTTSTEREIRLVGLTLKELRHELKRSEKAVEAERQQRDDLVSRRDSLVSGVRSGLDKGIWTPGTGSVWSETSGDPLAKLRASIAEINQFDALSGRLKKVLSGSAYDAIVGQGDLATVQAYASLDDATLAEFQRLYGVQQQRLNDVSNRVGDDRFGAELVTANKHLVKVTNRLERIEAAVDRSAKSNSAEQGENRAQQAKGATKAANGKSRGKVPKSAFGR